MEIIVSGALGKGRTILSAFDDALIKAGVGNYNLIKLSSVIPTGAKIKIKKKILPAQEDHGNKLFAVYTYKIAAKNESAWVGLGWVQIANGKGVFIEHEAESRKEVKHLIDLSLQDMKKRRKWKAENYSLIFGGRCKKDYLCALVIANYQVENWGFL